MSKAELIQFLREYDNAEILYRKYGEEERKIKSEIYDMNTAPKIESTSVLVWYLSSMIAFFVPLMIIVCIGLFVCHFTIRNFSSLTMVIWMKQFLSDVIDPLFGFVIFAYPALSILLSIPIDAVIAFPSAFFFAANAKDRNRKKIAKYRVQKLAIPALELKLKDIQLKGDAAWNRIEMMGKQGVVHPDYLNYASILADHLEKGRADTLKEAINLVEQRKADWHRELDARQHRREMEKRAAEIAAETSRAADASEQAASSAEKAAFWGAATTFIVASEAERQRRKDSDNL